MNAIDLTTLNAVKRRAEAGLKQDGSLVATPDDVEISAAITAFSQWLIDRSGLASLNSVVSLNEVYDGNGNNRMMLRMYPIQSLTSVFIGAAQIPVSTGPQQWGVFVDQSKKSIAIRGGLGAFSYLRYGGWASWSAGSMFRSGPVFSMGTGNINVVYTAGPLPTVIPNEVTIISANTITLQNGPWVSDGGVLYYPSLIPLVLVAVSPSAGQYAVTANGLYVFNSADNGRQVAVTYTANLAPFDLEYAVRCVVAINYKRKGWQDQRSRGVNATGSASTTSYQNWEYPPEYMAVFNHYQRKSPIT